MPRKNRTPQHQPFRQTATCQSKRRFATERQAKEAAEHQMLLKPDLQLGGYKCDFCGGWHLTRQIK